MITLAMTMLIGTASVFGVFDFFIRDNAADNLFRAVGDGWETRLYCKKRKRRASRTRMLKRRMIKLLEKLLSQRDGIHSAEELRRNDISYIYPGHKLYPGKLYDIPDPPMLLFAAGDVDVLADLDPAVAVVGARKASVYGREAADRLSGELAASGVTIVSGMALGIDGAAHRAAMKAGGKTVAVL